MNVRNGVSALFVQITSAKEPVFSCPPCTGRVQPPTILFDFLEKNRRGRRLSDRGRAVEAVLLRRHRGNEGLSLPAVRPSSRFGDLERAAETGCFSNGLEVFRRARFSVPPRSTPEVTGDIRLVGLRIGSIGRRLFRPVTCWESTRSTGWRSRGGAGESCAGSARGRFSVDLPHATPLDLGAVRPLCGGKGWVRMSWVARFLRQLQWAWLFLLLVPLVNLLLLEAQAARGLENSPRWPCGARASSTISVCPTRRFQRFKTAICCCCCRFCYCLCLVVGRRCSRFFPTGADRAKYLPRADRTNRPSMGRRRPADGPNRGSRFAKVGKCERLIDNLLPEQRLLP